MFDLAEAIAGGPLDSRGNVTHRVDLSAAVLRELAEADENCSVPFVRWGLHILGRRE